MDLQLENINVIVNISTLVGMWFALWRISTSVTTFTNRIDYIEKEHREVIQRIAKMETRHETNETRINDIHVSMARMEAKIDLLMNRDGKS